MGKIFSVLSDIRSEVATLNVVVREHIARDEEQHKATDLAEKQISARVKYLEDMKDKGIWYGFIAVCLSGAFGGGVAHIAHKLVP